MPSTLVQRQTAVTSAHISTRRFVPKVRHRAGWRSSGLTANRFAAGQSLFFSSNATHSAWLVIGKTAMVVSVNAIRCGWLRQ